jgi:uncharacterized protein YabN with tetrapyrrole methylase and pyrophosphatase domain
VEGPLGKVREELDELAAELERTGPTPPETEPDPRLVDEVGDVLFTIVNVARMLNVDPELALRATTGRFVARVERAQRLAAESGEDWSRLPLDEQERFYERAKSSLQDD